MTRSPAAETPALGRGVGRSVLTVFRRGSAAVPDGRQADSTAGTAVPPPDELEGVLSPRPQLARQVVICAIFGYFLIVPAAGDLWRRHTWVNAVVLAGMIVFTAVTSWSIFAAPRPGSRPVPWVRLALIVALGITLFVVGGHQGRWLAVLALAAAACGRFTATRWPAILGAASCTGAGLVIAVLDRYPEGETAAVLALPAMAAFFAYSALKRSEMVNTLRQTRAELARIAVSEERLRIARDLHDLLGHSLSLITLKAELTGRVIRTDAERAEREIADLEAVARQSLSDVREAVAGYRQPDLAAELAAGRQLLTAAGIACRITVPPGLDLPSEVDTVLAWTIREGITNVVRHARALSAAITVTSDRDIVVAEIVDDGQAADADGAGGLAWPGTGSPQSGAAQSGAAQSGAAQSGLVRAAAPPGPGLARLRMAGSGLAGLAERVRMLGGDLAAGQIQPRGFRLRVTIPVGSGER